MYCALLLDDGLPGYSQALAASLYCVTALFSLGVSPWLFPSNVKLIRHLQVAGKRSSYRTTPPERVHIVAYRLYLYLCPSSTVFTEPSDTGSFPIPQIESCSTTYHFSKLFRIPVRIANLRRLRAMRSRAQRPDQRREEGNEESCGGQSPSATPPAGPNVIDYSRAQNSFTIRAAGHWLANDGLMKETKAHPPSDWDAVRIVRARPRCVRGAYVTLSPSRAITRS